MTSFFFRLKSWYESEGRSLAPQSISRESSGGRETRKFVAQIKDEGLGRGNKPDYIAVRGTIAFIKQVSSVDLLAAALKRPFSSETSSREPHKGAELF